MKIQGADGIFFLVEAFVMGIIALICYYMWTQIVASAPSMFGPSSPAGQLGIIHASTSAFQLYINILVAVFFAVAIGSIISAFFVNSHPIFFIAGIFGTLIEIILSVIFHNAYFTLIQNSAFGNVFLQFTILNLFFQYLPEIAFVISIVVLIVTYGKGGQGVSAQSVGGGMY